MIGLIVLFGMIGVACLIAGSAPVAQLQPPHEPAAQRALPAPTRDHKPRLLALVERVESADRRREAGCALEQCAEHEGSGERKNIHHRTASRAHELGIEIRKAP